MIKHKLAAIVLSGSLAVTGTGFAIANVAKLNIEKNLVKTNRKVAIYVSRVNNTLNESKRYITEEEDKNKKLSLENRTLKDNRINKRKLANEEHKNEVLMRKIHKLEDANWRLCHENESLSNKLSKDNRRINNLLKTLSIMQGNSSFKNMSKAQQEKIIVTLLSYWGYGSQMAQSIAGMLSWGSGMNLDSWQNDKYVEKDVSGYANLNNIAYTHTLNKNVNNNININLTKEKNKLINNKENNSK